MFDPYSGRMENINKRNSSKLRNKNRDAENSNRNFQGPNCTKIKERIWTLFLHKLVRKSHTMMQEWPLFESELNYNEKSQLKLKAKISIFLWNVKLKLKNCPPSLMPCAPIYSSGIPTGLAQTCAQRCGNWFGWNLKFLPEDSEILFMDA